MHVRDFGDSTPSIAVVGFIHGDEPCGRRAIERVLKESPDFENSVRFVIANETAGEANQRYIDHDLNRAFPGDEDSTSHEERLAADIVDAVDDCKFVLALHSTRSTDEVFSLFGRLSDDGRDILRSLPINRAVDCSRMLDGQFIQYEDVIEVECGRQQPADAVDNAEEVIRLFLGATGAIDDDDSETEESPVQVYRLFGSVAKPSEQTRFVADNFERVDADEVFATGDEGDFRAEASFYLVLMSTNGYETLLGYKSEHVGPL